MSITRKLQTTVIGMILIMAAGVLTSFAQPLNKRIDFTVNEPFTFRMENYTLPAGRYILHQVDANDLNLFFLYQGNMTHSPIASILTTRIDYSPLNTPEHTKMLLTYKESTGQAEPEITGWTVPGDDGWEIIGVVPKNHSVLTKVN